VGGYAPRAREDSVRPRRLIGASGRPLNFTVRPRVENSSVLSRRCPECGEAAVESLRKSFNFRGPTHHCGSCNTDLRASLTAKALWCVPIGVVSVLAPVLAGRWLNRAEMPEVVRAAVTGAVGALAVGLPIGALAKGFVLRKWKP
jgi:hypothetical protein